MRASIAGLLAGIVALTFASAARADPGAGDPDVRLLWRLDFATARSAPQPAVALAFRHEGAPAGTVDLPLLARQPVLRQDAAEETPFGNRRWIWWVLSGVGIAALVASQSDGDDPPPAPAGTGGS